MLNVLLRRLMLAFEARGGVRAADADGAAVRLIVPATSLGGVETLIERRARWPGDVAGVLIPRSLSGP